MTGSGQGDAARSPPPATRPGESLTPAEGSGLSAAAMHVLALAMVRSAWNGPETKPARPKSGDGT